MPRFLVHYYPRSLVSNPSNGWYIAPIFQIWYALLGYEELAGKLEPVNQERRNILNE